MIELQAAISKSYKNRLVLDVDLECTGGRLYAILGPNGSGKSTLLRMLALIEEPDAGTVVFRNGDRVLINDLELRRRLVFVPSKKGLFNDTVINNVRYGLKIRKMKRRQREAGVESAMRSVGLWSLREANALALSDGEAQRLCLAMALAVKPEIILLDEPTSSLDPANAAIVEDIIISMRKTAQLILLVTHNFFQAGRLADEVIFLYQGKMIEYGPTADFLENPQTELARKFIHGEIVY